MNLNIGSASKKYNGYKNVDIRPAPEVDIEANLAEIPWPWEDNSVDRILAEEFFEHISWRLFSALVKETLRVLKPMGFIQLTVPDIGSMCRLYVAGLVCTCVPHKEIPGKGFPADPKCPNCHGKSKVNKERFRQAMAGAQKHPWDAHLNQFFKEDMMEEFKKAGFRQVLDMSPDNLYKIKLRAIK